MTVASCYSFLVLYRGLADTSIPFHSASMSLRRPLLTRWNPYMDESLDVLRTSQDALPSDFALIHWAKLAHLSEEITFQFSMDDPITNVTFTDPRIQYALKGFERQMDDWRKDVPPELYSCGFSLGSFLVLVLTWCSSFDGAL